MTGDDEAMRLALAEAELALAGGDVPVGAVLLDADGAVLATGRNEREKTHDPTAHAEVVAIRAACRQLGSFNLQGCEMYTSCEPCPMCLGAIYWARLDRVYYANTRIEAAAIGFDDDHIYREFDKPIDDRAVPFIHLQSEEARQIFREWLEKPDKIPY